METLTINIKNKKDSRLIRELLDRLDISIKKEKGKERLGREIPKSKLTPDDLRGMGGILKGQLISKEHLRSISWKKRNW
jgi:hypothetical protein